QRNLFPQFLTDTEVSALLFDLMARTYKYPVEYIIEALAPTTELDFDRLPAERRRIYRQLQAAHLRGSPDGPWFFIIARNLDAEGFQLLGITDTAMLRPQVFALQEGEVSVGLICSEKQAIDATLASLSEEDPRISPVADMYWNARGGSFNDGGAFMMNVKPTNGSNGNGKPPQYALTITNKFGEPVATLPGQVRCNLSIDPTTPNDMAEDEATIDKAIGDGDGAALFCCLRDRVVEKDYDWFRWAVDKIVERTADAPSVGIEGLTLAMDHCYPTGDKKRSSILTIIRAGIGKIFQQQPLFDKSADGTYRRIDWATRSQLREPQGNEQTLLIDARGFEPEGADCDARLAVEAYKLGWRHIVHYNSRGTRFHAAGFGPNTDGLRIDCYDNVGDYLGSGMDGLEVYVHCNAQDQLCQITKRGKLVVYGDVGQTFLYGAKGGTFFIRGNAAGRPMINAVGRPKVVINGTALDFLAESFMAGDPLNGGGFAIVNGMRFDEHGKVVSLDMPYPGSNLLSLASGGAIYVRDPHHTLVDEQLNGGMYRTLSPADWKLILPYLQENERLFGIRVHQDLLTVDGVLRKPSEVYRKVMPYQDAELESELEGMGE
ncbi:MAG: hypothetical protein JXM70_03425, partial [Pirellulales bacterium]|nr:hypothetical protein [Pirellulales bacterium]